jgi:hypothetical protein
VFFDADILEICVASELQQWPLGCCGYSVDAEIIELRSKKLKIVDKYYLIEGGAASG